MGPKECHRNSVVDARKEITFTRRCKEPLIGVG